MVRFYRPMRFSQAVWELVDSRVLTMFFDDARKSQHFRAAQDSIDIFMLDRHMAAIGALGSVNRRFTRLGRAPVVFPRASLFTRVVQTTPALPRAHWAAR
jgi:hypothetical protein